MQYNALGNERCCWLLAWRLRLACTQHLLQASPTQCDICAAATAQIQMTSVAKAGLPGRNALPVANTNTAQWQRPRQYTVHVTIVWLLLTCVVCCIACMQALQAHGGMTTNACQLQPCVCSCMRPAHLHRPLLPAGSSPHSATRLQAAGKAVEAVTALLLLPQLHVRLDNSLDFCAGSSLVNVFCHLEGVSL